MPTVKNVQDHPDDLPDGRVIAAYETAVVTGEQLASRHVRQRIAGGQLVVVPEPAPAPPPDPPAVAPKEVAK